MSRNNEIGTHKTKITGTNTEMIVTYHNTDVVTYRPLEQTVTLRSGGWRSKTTKLRMNQASEQWKLGYSVWQKNFKWFVTVNGETLEFTDGMTLNLGSRENV